MKKLAILVAGCMILPSFLMEAARGGGGGGGGHGMGGGGHGMGGGGHGGGFSHGGGHISSMHTTSRSVSHAPSHTSLSRGSRTTHAAHVAGTHGGTKGAAGKHVAGTHGGHAKGAIHPQAKGGQQHAQKWSGHGTGGRTGRSLHAFRNHLGHFFGGFWWFWWGGWWYSCSPFWNWVWGYGWGWGCWLNNAWYPLNINVNVNTSDNSDDNYSDDGDYYMDQD